MSLPYPTHVIFDWDGTLVDSDVSCLKILNGVLTHFQYKPLSLESYKKLPPYAMRDFFQKTFAPHQQKKALEVFHHYIRTMEHVEKMPGAQELLCTLQQKKITCSVVSNKEGIALRQELNILQWNHFFQSVVGSGDTAYNKPSPEPIYTAHSGPYTTTWFIGDSFIDMEAAKAAQCIPLYVGHLPLKNTDHVHENMTLPKIHAFLCGANDRT